MPHVTSDCDFDKPAKSNAEKPPIEDVYKKLTEAETDIRMRWCPMSWKGCICYGVNTACEAENTVYLMRP